jgi:hypothetical protein
MTRDEAVQLLGLDGETRGGSARRRYEELFNDYQIRLSNAPTPALKRKYRETLTSLESAIAVLAPTADIQEGDLPSRTPPSIAAPRDAEPIPPDADGHDTVAASRTVPRSVFVAFAGASVLAAGTALAGLAWYRAAEKVTALEHQVAALEERHKSTIDEQTRWRAILAGGPLQICNRSSAPLKVTALMTMYLRPSGERVYVHSGSFGYPQWTIAAGARERMEMIRGRADDWDGTASVYAVQVAYQGSEPFIVAGLWSDLRDGCLNLSLD